MINKLNSDISKLEMNNTDLKSKTELETKNTQLNTEITKLKTELTEKTQQLNKWNYLHLQINQKLIN